jgi:2-dehydro-3-deoxyphosphogluconate aldolase / (4S)-4-hydroxy-2-oxoglutarate aldolase
MVRGGKRMSEYEVLEAIRKTGVVSIVRGTTPEQMNGIADALYRGGVRIIEVTFNTPNASEIIKNLTKLYSDKMIIGAGTVLDAQTARTAILSGAQFILSPSLHADVIQMCNKYNILAVPGVFTPTEAITAWELGAKIVKIFPAGIVGPNYIKQLLGPLNQLRIMVVGGINEENFGSFMQAGAMGAGIGSDLVNRKLADAEDYDEIYRRAKHFTEIFEEYKQIEKRG